MLCRRGVWGLALGVILLGSSSVSQAFAAGERPRFRQRRRQSRVRRSAGSNSATTSRPIVAKRRRGRATWCCRRLRGRISLRVNRWVNETIKPVTDLEHWGVIERWSYPTDGYGDCEDYVLLKRKMLIEAGWPREALLITVVRDKRGDGHAVLTVKTDKGEFILDNQNEDILPWTETGYRLVKRQSQANQNIGCRSAIIARRSPRQVHARHDRAKIMLP